MHEMGVAMEIVEIAMSSIPDNIKNACVERVNLKVGKLAAIVPDSLRFCFDIVSKDTPIAGAKLNIEEIPVVARCKECDFKWTINSPVFKCKKCKSGLIDIVSGRELDIISIEVVDEQGE
ncbi:MAG: hydrogenase maturation nickel metallochaperone HypA [Pseudomonadota bacterium]